MSFSKKIGERLQSERNRLNYSQTDMVDIAKTHAVVGASQNQISRWERGDQAVNVEFLAVLANYGFDVTFVLTGRRSLDFSEAVVKQVLDRLDMPAMPADMKTPEALLLSMRFVQREFKPLNDDGAPFDGAVNPTKRRGRPPREQHDAPVFEQSSGRNIQNNMASGNTQNIYPAGKKKGKV